MTPERVRRAIHQGYEITIDSSTSEDPRLQRGATFKSVRAFDEALACAHAELDGATVALRWGLRTRDDCIQYRARHLLTPSEPPTPVCATVERDAESVLARTPPRDASAIAVAKVMRYAALVLRSELARAHAVEALAYVERLLPHRRVRAAARAIGGQP